MTAIPGSPSGGLRERLTIQAPAASVDLYGDPALAWSSLATVWARVRPAGGGVQTLAGRRTAIDDYEVTIRWRPDVSVRARLVWRGRTLEIERLANPDERRVFLVMQCRDFGPP